MYRPTFHTDKIAFHINDTHIYICHYLCIYDTFYTDKIVLVTRDVETGIPIINKYIRKNCANVVKFLCPNHLLFSDKIPIGLKTLKRH